MSIADEERRAFRNALGAFATGVTIATTVDGAGNPVGVTASSFNSVSLDPPLVLWSLAKNSLSREAFCTSGHFAVHVLAASQEDLSNRFARSGEDKFAGVPWRAGHLGSPVLDEHAALFECRTRYQYEGGDHIIMVGEVTRHETCDVAPLLFHGGRYVERRARPATANARDVVGENGDFSDDFLFYLISRAHFQTSRATRAHLAEHGVAMGEYLTMSILAMESPLTARDIISRLAHTGHAPDDAVLDNMVVRQFLAREGDGFVLADAGRALVVETLAYGKAFEADLTEDFTPGELAETKRVLRRIIELSGSDVPIVWRDMVG